MAKDKRLFARLDLDYADHPKVMMLSDAAFRAHITFLLYSRKYMTDGIINNRVANRVASQWDTDVLTELATNDEATPSLVKLENGDYYLHGYEDMQETRAEIELRTARNQANGRKGGRPPKTQSVTDSLTHSGTQSEPKPKAETETETETETNKEIDKEIGAKFEFAYSAWPKKTERKKSFEKFKQVCKKRDVDELVADIHRFADAYVRAGTETRFIPALVVWLNGERWTDDLPVMSHGSGRQSAVAVGRSVAEQLRAMGQ